MRLIDADAIVYTHEVARCLEDGHNWNELCVTQADIECMPTVDAVEIVRCKDCIHYEDNYCDSVNHHTGNMDSCNTVLGAERKTDEIIY